MKAAVEYLASWGDGATLRERIVSAMCAIGAWEHALAVEYDEAVRAIPGVVRRGPALDEGPRAPTVSITIAGVHPEEAARRLGEEGVLVRDGHFFALRPIEVLGLAEAGGVVRAGISMYNTREEVGRLVDGIARIARRA